MTPETIARLRAASLSATLTAARGRRFRRRAGLVALTAVALASGALFHLPRPAPAPAFTAAPPTPRTVRVIHTAPGTLAKITTAESVRPVRFSTDRARRTERLDTEGLARCFPDKGFAVIRAEGELAKIVIF